MGWGLVRESVAGRGMAGGALEDVVDVMVVLERVGGRNCGMG